MGDRLHIIALKAAIYFVFIVHCLVFLILTSIYRFIKKDHPLHYNLAKTTSPQIFYSYHDNIKINGFKIQEYQFETQDHAFVFLWRIVPENPKTTSKKVPVLLQHGLLDCSMTWFLLQQLTNCLPYQLAQQGYDVWVSNIRGTKFSSKNSHQPEYWEYNLDHIIQYDVPCIIDGILKQTGQKKLTYIGHSQGTIQFLASLDVHPELKNKIQCFVGLGPTIGAGGIKDHGMVSVLAKLKVCNFLKFIGFKSMLMPPRWLTRLGGVLIQNNSMHSRAFNLFMTALCGLNKKGDKIKFQRYGFMLSQQPGGCSINNVIHWMQIYERKKLAKFDYGRRKNIQEHGCEEPPEYTFSTLSSLPFHCYLFRGTSDICVPYEGFCELRSYLHPSNHTVFDVDDYAHLDYIWSENAIQDIYPKIVELVEEETY